MIREERDPAWWQAVADHPEVSSEIHYAGRVDFGFVTWPEVVPFATENGGLLFHHHEGAWGLHAVYRPEGWGREVAAALRVATEDMIGRGAEQFATLEVEGRPNSRPPLSHGWRADGHFAQGPVGLICRPWLLTVAAWRASPVYRRMLVCRQS